MSSSVKINIGVKLVGRVVEVIMNNGFFMKVFYLVMIGIFVL